MKVSVIIPARKGSTRLPNKPLADINGAPMIVHTWRAAIQHPDVDRVCVATDDADIAAAIQKAGGEAVMTDAAHTTGTDRCDEVWQHWGDEGAVINLQGDEPFPAPEHLSALCAALRENRWEVVSLMRSGHPEEPASTHRVKVAVNAQGQALYFSRSPIPSGGPFHIHLGLYGFAPGALARCASLPKSALEASEKLEQLRWLEAGVTVGMIAVEEGASPGSVDTEADLEKVRAWHRSTGG